MTFMRSSYRADEETQSREPEDLIVTVSPNGKTIEVDLLKNILNALVELDNAVKTMATANPKPNLLPLFARLDELTQQLPRNADPTLLHYLHKKSYEKARLFLQDRDAENQVGNCRHV
jgi:hypothetical protein